MTLALIFQLGGFYEYLRLYQTGSRYGDKN